MDLHGVGKIKSSAPLFLSGYTGKVKLLAVKIYLWQSREIKFPTSYFYPLFTSRQNPTKQQFYLCVSYTKKAKPSRCSARTQEG